MYYALISLAAVFFGVQFFFNDIYQKKEGSGLSAAYLFILLTSLARVIMMFFLNGMRVEFSWFSLGVSLIYALVNVGFSYCSIKALQYANLSLFSIFTMLGGMLVPFITGILFWKEPLTWPKAICCLLIIVALYMSYDPKEKSQRGAGKYYFLIFLLNGMYGFVAKIHQSFPWQVSNEGYILLGNLWSVVLGVLLLLTLPQKKFSLKAPLLSIVSSIGCAGLNGFGDLLLLISLMHLDASVQYTFVTGGTIIVSSLIALCQRVKLRPKEWIATGIALAATLFLL